MGYILVCCRVDGGSGNSFRIALDASRLQQEGLIWASGFTKKVEGRLLFWKDRLMEWISRGIDKLPSWAKVIFFVLTVIVSVYCVARYGFWSFLLKVIFSP